jgi:hypothetical protein
MSLTGAGNAAQLNNGETKGGREQRGRGHLVLSAELRGLEKQYF